MPETRSPKLGDPPRAGMLVSGQRLGDYEILKRIATGGMAEIFLARVRKLTGFQKMVVIKRILPQLAQNVDFIEMFLDEARIAATLEHPHIVQTYDVGMIDDSYYIAMEYLHGEDVRSIMRAAQERLQTPPTEQALHIIISAAAGLHYAHEKVGFDGQPLDIVHRDVSPQNLIVTYEGSVKLLDFGIAKASNRLRETRVGTLKGKVPYMSPEQCRSETLDRRSDIYSLGIIMWELTLSRRLYRGTSDFDVLKEIVEGRVTPPHEIDPNYPPALEAIVMRALEKQRESRWQTAREMQAELEQFVRQQQIAATPIAVQQFMHELFGHKIEGWREAQAAGQTLDEHLLTRTPEYSDTKEIEVDDPQAQRVRAEREAFLAKLVPKPVVAPDPELQPQRSDRLGRVLGAVVALLFTVAAVTYALRLHQRSMATDETAKRLLAVDGEPVPTAARSAVAAAPLAANAPIAAANAPAKAANAPSELDEPPATGVQQPSAPAAEQPSAAPPAAVNADAPALAEPPVVAPALAAAHPSSTHRPSKRHPLPTLPTLLTVPATTVARPRTPPSGEPAMSAPAPAAPSPAAADVAATAPARPAGPGTLMVATSPWCRVVVDGTDRGATPLEVKLPSGPHTLLLVNPEFHIRREMPIVIHPGATLRKRLDFAD